MTRGIGHFLIYWKKEAFHAKGDLPYAEKTEEIFVHIIFERTADAACGLREIGKFPDRGHRK